MTPESILFVIELQTFWNSLPIDVVTAPTLNY